MPLDVKYCPDCGEEVGTLWLLMEHYAQGCPATTVMVVIGIRKDGVVLTLPELFSVPEYKPTEELPDLPALLRYMADQVEPVKHEVLLDLESRLGPNPPFDEREWLGREPMRDDDYTTEAVNRTVDDDPT